MIHAMRNPLDYSSYLVCQKVEQRTYRKIDLNALKESYVSFSITRCATL